MSSISRPFRSVLYIPGSKPRALEKARSLTVDSIIFDLEDAVAPDEKEKARSDLSDALKAGGYGARYLMVRVNGSDTPWGADDLDTFRALAPDAILLPKVGAASDIAAAAQGLSERTRIWAMMETPQGVLNASDIARMPQMGGFVMGTNDLAKDLRCAPGVDRLPMMTALQTCLLAARVAGIVCVDGVFNAFRDDDGLRHECEQGRDLGMDGKTLIHPAQVEIANKTFGPSDAEIDLSLRQIEAFDAATRAGQGVAVLDGRIVENLHVETARRILAQRDAIAAMDG